MSKVENNSYNKKIKIEMRLLLYISNYRLI